MTAEKLKAERTELGEALAQECERIAELCRRAGKGNRAALASLGNNVDGYWHAIVIGTGCVETLLDDEHWEA